jgi:hypothetical protein
VRTTGNSFPNVSPVRERKMLPPPGHHGAQNSRLESSCGLRSLEYPAADLSKFRYQFARISAAQRCGIYFRSQQDGRCHISAAFKTELVDPSWKFDQLGSATAHTTVTNEFLINTLQII